MQNKSITYLVTTEYTDDNGGLRVACGLVELVEEDDVSEIKSTIRLVLDLPHYCPMKIICMCPMLHLNLEGE